MQSFHDNDLIVLLDCIVRFSAFGILLLVSVLLLRDARGSCAGRFSAIFAITVAGYLFFNLHQLGQSILAVSCIRLLRQLRLTTLNVTVGFRISSISFPPNFASRLFSTGMTWYCPGAISRQLFGSSTYAADSSQ